MESSARCEKEGKTEGEEKSVCLPSRNEAGVFVAEPEDLLGNAMKADIDGPRNENIAHVVRALETSWNPQVDKFESNDFWNFFSNLNRSR